MSTAPTIIRIKRRFEEEPSSLLVVAGKRQKLDDSSSETFEQTFSLAGTIHEKHDIGRFMSKDRVRQSNKRNNDISLDKMIQKRLLDKASATSEKRFKIFEERRNCGEVSVIDIQEEVEEVVTVNGVEMVREFVKQREEFVYDLYYAPISVDYLDGPLTVQYYHDIEVDDTPDEPKEEDESDDENKEDYYTNDYPSTPEEEGDSDVELYGHCSLTEHLSKFVIDDEEGSEEELEAWEAQMQKVVDGPVDKKEDDSASEEDSF